jgi:signal transduction histidine kinase
MSPIAAKKNIKIMDETEAEGLPAVFDEARIGQVIINLLNNAVKYTYNNTSIFIKARYVSSPEKLLPDEMQNTVTTKGQYCLLSVRDEGPGMEPKYCQRIFDQFYQIGDANTRKHEGVGLGLNISKNIIKAHSGFIWAESKGKDTGSVFYFAIPTGI